MNTLLRLSTFALFLSSLAFAFPLHANEPCTAILYDFGGGSNVVPCGPAANTTSHVAIQGMGATAFALDGSCGSPGNGGSPTDALWVTFVIQEGGSFEWQTVPGSDDFYWELYYSSDPVDMVAEESTQSGCGSLVYKECGAEFTGWKVSTTPDATKQWRFYLVFFLRNGDQTGDGVVKIRKSCGEACAASDIAVTASNDVCINSGGNTVLDATPSGGGGGPYTYLWSPTTGLNNPAIKMPTASPVTTTTYTVQVVGSDGCPATDEVTVTVGACCDAEAGAITNNGAGPFTICTDQDLVVSGTEIIFNKTGHNASLAYAFVLADALGNIIASNTTGNFGPIANVGSDTVYGLSFDETQNAQTVTTYLAGKTTIAQIIADDNDTSSGGAGSGTLCLDLVSGAAGNNKITIKEPNCGTF